MLTATTAQAILALVASPAAAQTAASRTLSAEAPGAAVTARFDVAAKQLLYKSCSHAPCDLVAGEVLPLNTQLLIQDSMVTLDAIPLGQGRSLLHARIEIDEGHVWEALVAPIATKPVLASGWTGYTKGEAGERTGLRIDEVPRSDGTESVVVGELHEDRKICGQTETLVMTRAVDPATFTMRTATVPRLDAAARAKALPLPTGAPVAYVRPLAILARATATSGEGSATAISDGDLATAWHEDRSGDGHGEFVTFATDPTVPIRRVAFVLAPTAPLVAPGSAPASAPVSSVATPLTLDLVAEGHLYAVTFADGMKHPGESYVADLPAPLTTSCMSIVLDRPDTDLPHPEVTIAEATAYGAFDLNASSLGAVAALLGDPAKGDEAAATLERAGDDGVKAAAGVFGTLDAPGRARAVVVAESGSCEAAADLLVRAYTEKVSENRVETKLRRCEGKAAQAVTAALSRPGATPDLGRLAAEVAPDESLGQLLLHTNAARGDRSAWREAFEHATSRATSGPLAAELLAKRPAELELELVRALGRRAGDDELASASASIATKAAASTNAAERYLAVDPLVSIARAPVTRDLAIRVLTKLASDDQWTVRLAVAERAGSLVALSPATASLPTAAVDDAQPRVREAALRSLAEAHLAPPSVASHSSAATEAWTFVRSAAVATLQADGDPNRGRSDDALAHAADSDPSPVVRTGALDALAVRGGAAARNTVIRSLERDPEIAEVRAHAAAAAGRLCLHETEDRLTELAAPIASPAASEDAQTVGRVALAALGRLHPSDLSTRMSRFESGDTPPEARAVVRQALLARDVCPTR